MSNGFVSLVGAGCGENLITLKGLKALTEADVIIYDALIDISLLDYAPLTSEKIYAGKRAGQKSVSQDEINALLLKHARMGKRTVRLKCGDPYVFGRGGEEALFLKKENVPFEIIPGVSSAAAVPAFFGIPLTFRGVARSFTVIAGREAGSSEIDCSLYAKIPGTLVFLMALGNIKNICLSLIRNGKDKNAPASVLANGFSEDAKRIDGTVSDIYKKIENLKSPAILIVGDAASFNLNPNYKFSVTVTGTNDFISSLSPKLKTLGALVNKLETIKIIKHEENIPKNFLGYDLLVFTSEKGVNIFFETLLKRKTDLRSISGLSFACVGKKTAEALIKNGFHPDITPKEYDAENLGEEICENFKGKGKILILRAKDGSKALTDALLKHNFSFDDIFIYETAFKESAPVKRHDDYIVFSSPKGVRFFFENGNSIGRATAVVIGRETKKELIKHYGGRIITPKNFLSDGVADAIKEDLIWRDSENSEQAKK